MKRKYMIYFTIAGTFLLFFGYFMICFCGVYQKSQLNWLIGGMTSLSLRLFVIEIIIPILKASNIHLALKIKSR